MPFTRHTDRKYRGTYLKLGNHHVAEVEVADLWTLMCGEEEIKKFLAKCEKDGSYTVAELKKVQ